MSIVPLSSQKQPPPWQVVVLVANHLDPKTLAISSCVCKSWSPGSATDIKNGDLGSFDTLGDVIIMWDVILEGYRGVFNVMNCKGKGRFVLGLEGWFSEELPPPGCCSIETVSGLVADLRLGLKLEDGKAMVENISAGILSIISWRYLFVEDALRYLQHFLSS
ncbi:probable F-box protein At5g04010 [Solanum lycopersicum]|uniref:probable F-box protein At5g04010 n=1 Tax=Solanum lycopersicum TaxID=4081 RepID=UPI00374A36BE